MARRLGFLMFFMLPLVLVVKNGASTASSNPLPGDFIDQIVETKEVEEANDNDVAEPLNNGEEQSKKEEIFLTTKLSEDESSDNAPVAGAIADNEDDESNSFVADSNLTDLDFLIIVILSSCLGVAGLVVAVVCWYKLQQNAKSSSEVEYPAYGVTGPSSRPSTVTSGDRKLAQSAQMYHYQHQKQQMIALESHQNGDSRADLSESDSEEEENEDGDYTVYECPGLAPAGEMTVRNPLFTGPDDHEPPSPRAPDDDDDDDRK